MKRVVLVAVAVLIAAGLFLMSGCGPSTKEMLEQKTKENEDLQAKVTELEKEVQKLQGDLSTCQEELKNLLYYNKDKGSPSR